MDHPPPPTDGPSPIPEPLDSWEELVGCSGYRGPKRSLEEMTGAIREGALERFPGLYRKEPSC